VSVIVKNSPDNLIEVKGHVIGPQGLTIIAGPCSVEAVDITLRIARQLKNRGVHFFRAGAFKPRTSPHSFQGMGNAGLQILDKVRRETGMIIVTEAMDTETLPQVADVADIIQVGARNMNNTTLLKKLGKINKPVLLKRGIAATLSEWLLAAEYILLNGNPRIILCERGIRTFVTHSRFTLDVAAIPAIKKLTHLPIIVDPSHASGVTHLVPNLSYAAVAAGAQGLIIEVHDDAENAYSDGQQAVTPDNLATIVTACQSIYTAVQ
jgi:3-deoxy-7-phosphoheptulonate synthase